MNNTAALVMIFLGGTMMYSGLKGWSMSDTIKYFSGLEKAPTKTATKTATQTPSGLDKGTVKPSDPNKGTLNGEKTVPSATTKGTSGGTIKT